jgi:hypothetical protein
MGRTFTTFDLVQLPHLDAGGAQSLATSVLTAGKQAKLNPSLKNAYTEVAAALKALEAAVRSRMPVTEVSSGQRAKQSDMVIDSAWSGTFDWVNGWAKMPFLAQAALAATLREQLFPDGLKFVLIPYRLEWAESNNRLTLIKEKKLDAVFDKLGGAPILDSLRKAHKAYGDALNITEASDAEESASVRDALADLLDALRAYVVKVSATVDRKKPKTAKLADKLLAPIMTWQSTGGRGTGAPGTADAAGDGSEGAPAGEPVDAPALAPAKKDDPVPA